MEAAITGCLLIFVIVFVMVRGKLDEKQQRIRYRKRLQEQYGQFPQREYGSEELESIPSFYLHQGEKVDFFLDDITWNDLDMDRIFAIMNHTQSSSGAEYLYYLLRTPKQKDQDFEQWERHIRFFMEQEEQRLTIQMILHDLGRTGRFSLFDYMDYLDGLGKKSNRTHALALLALVFSFACIFVNTTVGVLLFLAITCFQIGTYLAGKKEVLPYLTSFAYITRLVGCAESIEKQKLTELSDYKAQLQKTISSLEGFKKGYQILSKMNTSTGNPLELLIEYVKMITHIDLMQFNRTLSKVQDKRQEITRLAEEVGYLDAVIAVGAFRESLPFYCVPTLSGTCDTMHMEEGFHPTISEPVANSFSQDRGMVITGSNASGKSTFLKMTAVNAILAQTIHTCAAKSYQGNFYQIYTSMALRDSLESGESYYIVEIKALKRIMDIAEQVRKEPEHTNPLLCFVDEVLRGTNTVERIAASTKILERLAHKKILCFAATHDIELTHLLEQAYDNYHFEEEVKDGDVLFSYHLLEGRAVTRNAIRLLQVIGFDEEMIQSADELAARFVQTGEWS